MNKSSTKNQHEGCNMKIAKRLLMVFLCLFLLSGASLAIAECNKNEVFNAYGFYNQGGFPEYTMLMGPFTTISECQEAEKRFFAAK